MFLPYSLLLFFQVDREVYSVPALPNIRHLELEVLVDDSLVLEQINCFIEACSYMQKLVIRVSIFALFVHSFLLRDACLVLV